MTSSAVALPDDPQAVLAAADDPHQFVLVALDRAKLWLITAASVEDVREVRARAEAMRAYTVQMNLGKEAEQAASEIRIRAEHRIGEMLKESPPKVGRPSKSSPSLRVSDHGLTENESAEFQKLAAVPEFDETVDRLRNEGRLSRAAVLREAAQQEEDEHRQALADRGITPLDPVADADEIARLKRRNTDIGRVLGAIRHVLDTAVELTAADFVSLYGTDVVVRGFVDDLRDATAHLSELLSLLEAS